MIQKTSLILLLSDLSVLGFAAPAAACGGEDHDDKKDESARLCGGEDHDDKKDESARL